MSYTNSTSHYQLPQYIGTDIPSILTDVNNAYQKIDTAIYEVAQTAAGATQDVSAMGGRVTDLERDMRAANTNITRISGDLESVKGVIPDSATSENQLITEANIDDVRSDVADIKDLIPEEATADNKLVTADDLDEVSADTKAVDLRVQTIEAAFPSTASASNKLATMADIGGGGSGKQLIATVPFTGMTDSSQVAIAVASALSGWNFSEIVNTILCLKSAASDGAIAYVYKFDHQSTPYNYVFATDWMIENYISSGKLGLKRYYISINEYKYEQYITDGTFDTGDGPVINANSIEIYR